MGDSIDDDAMNPDERRGNVIERLRVGPERADKQPDAESTL
jgi:hypothetical protein